MKDLIFLMIIEGILLAFCWVKANAGKDEFAEYYFLFASIGTILMIVLSMMMINNVFC